MFSKNYLRKNIDIFDAVCYILLFIFVTTTLCAETGEILLEKVNSLSKDDKTVPHIFSKVLTGKELKKWHSEIDDLVSYGKLCEGNEKITNFISSYTLFEYLDSIYPKVILSSDSAADYSIIAAWRVHEYVDYVLIPRIVISLKKGRVDVAKQIIAKIFILFPPESRYCHFGVTALSRVFPNAILYSQIDDDFFEWLKGLVSVHYSALTTGEARARFITRLLLFNIHLAEFYRHYGHWPTEADVSPNAFIEDYKMIGNSYRYIAKILLPNGDILYGASKKDISNTTLPNTTEIFVDISRLRIIERLNTSAN